MCKGRQILKCDETAYCCKVPCLFKLDNGDYDNLFGWSFLMYVLFNIVIIASEALGALKSNMDCTHLGWESTDCILHIFEEFIRLT